MYANGIKAAREEKAMPPTELAFRIGVGQTQLWRYETGRAQPSLATARRIAQVLGSTVDDLFPPEPDTEAAA